MMNKNKVCTQCTDGKIKPTIRGLCQYHYRNFLQAKSKPFKKVVKSSGQLDLFKKIWADRPHRCFVTGIDLNDLYYYQQNNQFHWLFHHVLPKGLYGKFKLYEPNIIIVLPSVHHDIETLTEANLLKKYPGYSRLLTLKQELKDEYLCLQ